MCLVKSTFLHSPANMAESWFYFLKPRPVPGGYLQLNSQRSITAVLFLCSHPTQVEKY